MALELVAAQQQINEMYEKLGQASATPLDASELRKALTSSEQCTLEKAGFLDASLGNATCKAFDATILADNSSDVMVDADVYCWRRSPLRPSQLVNGNCSIRAFRCSAAIGLLHLRRALTCISHVDVLSCRMEPPPPADGLHW
jgi:hypothetical protein